MSLELASPPETAPPEEEPEGTLPSLAWPTIGNYEADSSDGLTEAGFEAYVQAEICEQIEGISSPYAQALYKVAGRYLIEANIAWEVEGRERDDDILYPKRLIRIGQSLTKQVAAGEGSETYSDFQPMDSGRQDYFLELAQSNALRALAPKGDPHVSMAGGTLSPKSVAEVVVQAAADTKHRPSGVCINADAVERLEEQGMGAVVDVLDKFSALPARHWLPFVVGILDGTEQRMAEESQSTNYALAA